MGQNSEEERNRKKIKIMSDNTREKYALEKTDTQFIN